jgi:hypothetical protein
MKKFIIGLLVSISFSAMAQQESQFYIRIKMKDDTTGKYLIRFNKYTADVSSSVPYGSSISFERMKKSKWIWQRNGGENEDGIEDRNEVHFNSERKYYDYSNKDSMFACVVKIIIEDTNTSAQMYIIVPINVHAKWTELFLEDVNFKRRTYINVLKNDGRFDKSDNTLKIFYDKKTKIKYAPKSYIDFR